MDITYEFQAPYSHRIVFRPDLLEHDWSALCAPEQDRLPRGLLLRDAGLHAAHPELTTRIEQAFPLDWSQPLTIAGGETCKNDPQVLEQLLQDLHDAHLCRRSYLVVAGGGAILDLAGLAAALTHRGIRLIRLPSTTLAQCDSGVGVKNGVNRFGKKNFLGTFALPWAVLCDPNWLASLTPADWIAGFSEAVKVALLKDPQLFHDLEASHAAIAERDLQQATPLLARSAELHAEHITRGGDPFEDRVARPLDFGHWAAHKLEQLSDFELSHGHAVATGLAIDVHYSAAIGLLAPDLAERICRCLQQLGFGLSHPLLHDPAPLLDGLEEFREHLGGPLTITLLQGIGDSVDVNQIDSGPMQTAIQRVAALQTSGCP